MMDIQEKSPTLTQKLYPCGFRHDAKTLVMRTFAFIVSYVLASWAFTTVSLAFISRLGPQERDGCALAFSVYVLVGNSILSGLNFGADTLLPQCFGGNKRKMGVIVQRAMIVDVYACLFIWTLMLNAKYVLQYIEQDPYILEIVNEFLQIYILLAPIDGFSLVLRMYIASTGRTKILVGMNIIGNIVNILSHYICIYQLNMGFRAAPVSLILAYASILITAIIYIRFSSIYKDTWHPITRACLQEWDIFLKLALPGAVLVIIEASSIELSIFFTSPLGIVSLSAQVVVKQIIWLLYLVMISLGDAATILIGEYIGANKPMQAANAKNVTYAICAIMLMIDAFLLLITHPWLPYLFNIEPDALSLTRYGLLLGAVVSIVDGLSLVQTGIVKACGMQRYAAIFLFIGFYIIGLPSAYIFMYIFDMDIFGFWTGMILAETLIDILLFILIWDFNFNTFSKNAEENIRLTDPSISVRNDSLASINTDEHMRLLPYTSNQKDNENINEHSTELTQSNNEEEDSNGTASNESLFKLVAIKLLVLIPLLCLFILSFINSFR